MRELLGRALEISAKGNHEWRERFHKQETLPLRGTKTSRGLGGCCTLGVDWVRVEEAREAPKQD